MNELLRQEYHCKRRTGVMNCPQCNIPYLKLQLSEHYRKVHKKNYCKKCRANVYGGNTAFVNHIEDHRLQEEQEHLYKEQQKKLRQECEQQKINYTSFIEQLINMQSPYQSLRDWINEQKKLVDIT